VAGLAAAVRPIHVVFRIARARVRAGLTQAIVWTVIATLILSNTSQSMRGRVMGLRTGVVISLPIGNLLAGAVAERFGAPIAQGLTPYVP